MGERNFRCPISLESVHADITVGGDVGMVDLRQEEPSRGRVRKIIAQDELDVKRPAIVGRSNCSRKRTAARAGGAGVLVCCLPLSHPTTDNASLSRRSTVRTPNTDTSNIGGGGGDRACTKNGGKIFIYNVEKVQLLTRMYTERGVPQ